MYGVCVEFVFFSLSRHNVTKVSVARAQDEKQVKDWHRLYDDILRCRRVMLQTGIVKYPAQEEVGFLRSAFYRSVLRLFLLFLRNAFSYAT